MESFVHESDDGPFRFERVVAYYEVWTVGRLPFAKIRMKVIKQLSGGYFASPNIAVLNPNTGHPEGVGGHGPTVREALIDAMRYLMLEIQTRTQGRELTANDFEWYAAEDF